MTDQVTVPVADTVTEADRITIRVAVIRERQRMIELIAGGGLRGYGTGGYSAVILKMTRDMFPDMGLTQDVWNALGGGSNPDYNREGFIRPQGWEATVAAWRASIDAMVGELTGQPALPDMPDVEPSVKPATPEGKPAPIDEVDEEDEEPERTCECDRCDDDHCQAECDECDDHGCEQCKGHHDVRRCCGYCESCETHVDGDWPVYGYGPGTCDQGTCHTCEHVCEDY